MQVQVGVRLSSVYCSYVEAVEPDSLCEQDPLRIDPSSRGRVLLSECIHPAGTSLKAVDRLIS